MFRRKKWLGLQNCGGLKKSQPLTFCPAGPFFHDFCPCRAFFLRFLPCQTSPGLSPAAPGISMPYGIPCRGIKSGIFNFSPIYTRFFAGEIIMANLPPYFTLLRHFSKISSNLQSIRHFRIKQVFIY